MSVARSLTQDSKEGLLEDGSSSTRRTRGTSDRTAVGVRSIRRGLALGGLLAFAWAGSAGAAFLPPWGVRLREDHRAAHGSSGRATGQEGCAEEEHSGVEDRAEGDVTR